MSMESCGDREGRSGRSRYWRYVLCLAIIAVLAVLSFSLVRRSGPQGIEVSRLRAFEDFTEHVLFSPDAKWLVCTGKDDFKNGDGLVKVWDMSACTGEWLQGRRSQPVLATVLADDGDRSMVQFSHDGSLLVSMGINSGVSVRRAGTWEDLFCDREARTAVVTPDGTRIAILKEKAIEIRALPEFNEVIRIPIEEEKAFNLLCSSNGEYLLGLGPKSLTVVDTQSNAVVAHGTLTCEHYRWLPGSVGLTHDDRYLTTLSSESAFSFDRRKTRPIMPKTVHHRLTFWDRWRNGQPTPDFHIRIPSWQVHHACFNASGTTMAVSCVDFGEKTLAERVPFPNEDETLEKRILLLNTSALAAKRSAIALNGEVETDIPIGHLAFGCGDRLLAGAGATGEVIVWRLNPAE
ncbi:MAG TPA: WD40 repeat domain-containing protein [Candidatus Brocadiia bacterium]|nr:WD40 repeat domain-containing protein [Candidatus Brocadiia bacterium]